MELNEYKELILEEVRVESEINFSDITSEFIKYVSDILISAEEFDDFTETYFEAVGKSRRKIQIDGFSIDEVDKSCILVLCQYFGHKKSNFFMLHF